MARLGRPRSVWRWRRLWADAWGRSARARSGIRHRWRHAEGAPHRAAPQCAISRESGLSSIRRLSRSEYERTVEAALGVPPGAVPATISDELVHGTDFVANTSPVSIDHARSFLNAARAAADTVDLALRLPCAVSAGDRECVSAFVGEVAPLLHRRPVDAATQAAYLAVFDATIVDGGFEPAVRAVLEAMLQSPFFLYHVELGEAGTGTGRLTGPELANRLSFMLWRAPPDDTLRAAAESDALLSDSELEKHTRRLLADDRAIVGVQAFLSSWLGIPEVKDADLDDLGRSAREELGRFAGASAARRRALGAALRRGLHVGRCDPRRALRRRPTVRGF